MNVSPGEFTDPELDSSNHDDTGQRTGGSDEDGVK